MASSPSVFEDLHRRGFPNLRQWSHDVEAFRPVAKTKFDLPRPIFLYVGRVTVDKNLPTFLDLDLPGSKVVVATGRRVRA